MSDPVYIKIHNAIKKDIEKQVYTVGQRIPAERQLAEKFGVSRMTLRQAIKTLEEEGFLERRLGSGTYVASQKVREKMSGVMSFTEIMRANGQVPSSKLISYRITKPTATEKELLDLNNDEDILRMERVRYADQVPICFEAVAVPYHLVKHAPKSQVAEHLYKTVLAEDHRKIGKVTEHISAMNASDRLAKELKCHKGEALITRRQVTEFDDGTPFEYTKAQYVSDRFEFTFSK
ncbi:MAG: GntR family transcriptional regulator [Lactobacillus sp.]|nr:GntR family transcriptional regulator [Lactobacillus sp.]